jgi:methyltransferase (TIGR00027 family)
VKQYVILGAGLDTFAYRQPSWGGSVQIYEVDDPITQQWKGDRLRVADVAIPSHLTVVPIDFERVSIPDALESTGFACDAKTLCSWMGVIQYLTPHALDATFQFVLSLQRSSEIVFSFVLPPNAVSGIEAEALAIAAERAAEVGEPWLTRFTSTSSGRNLKRWTFRK